MKVKCLECGAIVGENPNIQTNADFLVQLSFCAIHEPTQEPIRDMEAEWKEVNLKIMEMAARGQILDAQNNPVSAVMVTDGEARCYAIDPVSDKLVEVCG